jgi:2-C-methyl-D-erythritol 4-phosphate cytidylyltransferase
VRERVLRAVSDNIPVSKVAVILPAAGLGTRMGRSSAETGGTSRKQFMLLDGSPILAHTVRKFLQSDRVSEIVVAVRPDDLDWVTDLLRDLLQKEERDIPVRAVAGGDSRQQSVENAFASLTPDTTLVAVHDAVRPFVDVETIDRAIAEAEAHGAAIVGIVPVDTVKQVSGAQASGAKVRTTISRERLILAQTPQVFQYDLLRRAFEAARKDGFIGTDESSLIERLESAEVSVVLGSERNIKITRPNDMELARLFLEQDNRRLASREGA